MITRITLFFAFFLALVGSLMMRSFMVQVLPNTALGKLQKRQYMAVMTLPAQRGSILDRQGEELASSVAAESLYADPTGIEQPRRLSKKLAPLLNMSAGDLSAKLMSDKRFVWIKRQLDSQLSEEIKSWKIKGLGFVPEGKRSYPNLSLASQIIGFVGQEGNGREGLELKYDKELRGESQSVLSRRDARGRPLLVSGQLFQLSPDGADVQLTIDKEIQYELEHDLNEVLTQQEAESATGVVLDPKTGEVLAMASAPGYDNASYAGARPENRKNRAITDVYEPGSTFKAVLAAAAIHSGKIQPNTKYFCEHGVFHIGKRIIHEAETHDKFGWLTLAEILQVSSNIGSTKIAFSLGQDYYRKAIADFGFGKKTGIDIPGESNGIVLDKDWPDHLFANISFGHGIGVTALQVASAYAVIANGGRLLRPFVVASIRDKQGHALEERKPEVIREVLSKKEASTVTLMLTGATEEGGTGTLARVDGYPVAGKTGTAQRVDTHGHGYKRGAYISSFAGFVPANNPQFVIYIVVNEPKKQYYGAQVAAPVFQKVASFALRRRGFMPIVINEKLTAKTEIRTPQTTVLAVQQPAGLDTGLVPELKGLTLREVARKLHSYQVSAVLIGAGVAYSQVPEPGQKISPGTKLRVYFRP